MKISKRILGVVIALVMLISVVVAAIPVSAASATTFVIGTVECYENGDVVVPVSVENNNGFWGANLQIVYPIALTYKGVAKVESSLGNCMATAADNVITFLIEASSEEKDITTDGVLFNITFTAANWTKDKTYALNFYSGDRKSVTNAQGENLLSDKDDRIPVAFTNGAVKCVEKAVATEPSETPTEPTQPSETPTQPSQPSDQPTQPSETPTEKPVTCGHFVSVVKGVVKATYFAKGYSGDKVCANCGEVVEFGKATAKKTLKVPKFKLTSGKKQFKVKYTKVTGATGFQVRYKIKGSWKTKNFDTKKTATKVVKNLKKGKYQVQIRAYVKSGKKTAYSNWAKVQKVTVK